VSPGFILPFCRYRPVQADAGLPAWSSLPTELEYKSNMGPEKYLIGISLGPKSGSNRNRISLGPKSGPD
jgi:hypothetical protein